MPLIRRDTLVVGEALAIRLHRDDPCVGRKRSVKKVAVDGLNLTMYSGQVTALLGHNGAGKVSIKNKLNKLKAKMHCIRCFASLYY